LFIEDYGESKAKVAFPNVEQNLCDDGYLKIIIRAKTFFTYLTRITDDQRLEVALLNINLEYT